MSVYERLGLPHSWRLLTHYTVLLSDFEEGAPFIGLWERWKRDPARPQRLHVVALTRTLIDAQALRTRLRAQISPEQHALVEQLVAQWPLNLPGTHRLDFEGMAVTLTLVVGPVELTLPRLAVWVDAVLFSDLVPHLYGVHDRVWHDALVRIARDPAQVLLALPDGQTIRGCHDQDPAKFVRSPTDRMVQQFQADPRLRYALVVGAGIAGAGIAHALALRGWRVQVLDVRQRRTQQHGGHLAAALTPMVTRDDDVRARLSRAGSLRAQARWSHVGQDVLWRCGALQLQRVSGRIVDLAALADGLGFPSEWVRYVEPAEASEIAGISLNRGGLYFPTAARIRPETLIDVLLETPNIERLDVHVERFTRRNGQWEVMDANGEVVAAAPQLILACAMGAQGLLRRSQLLESGERLAGMHALGGEITLLPQEALVGGPRCIVSGDGYVLPAVQGHCIVGSSYVHGAQVIEPSLEGALDNIARASSLLGQPKLPATLNDTLAANTAGWAGWRAVLPGRLPAVGPWVQAEGLWVAAGFASRGLTWSSLAGDLIAAALSGEPLPLERDIMDKISQT